MASRGPLPSRPDDHSPSRRGGRDAPDPRRSEEHTSELQPLMRISSALFRLQKQEKSLHMECDYLDECGAKLVPVSGHGSTVLHWIPDQGWYDTDVRRQE